MPSGQLSCAATLITPTRATSIANSARTTIVFFISQFTSSRRYSIVVLWSNSDQATSNKVHLRLNFINQAVSSQHLSDWILWIHASRCKNSVNATHRLQFQQHVDYLLSIGFLPISICKYCHPVTARVTTTIMTNSVGLFVAIVAYIINTMENSNDIDNIEFIDRKS